MEEYPMRDFTSSKQGSLPVRLAEARKGTGLSTRDVARTLAERFPVSHASIANYEKGRTQPTLALLAALAEVYERPLTWFLEGGRSLTGIRYRNLQSRVRESEKHRYEASALRWLEAYVKIEDFLAAPLDARLAQPPPPKKVDPHVYARAVRQELGIADDAPIPSVIEGLEAFGIRVIEVPTELRIDGFAAVWGNEPVVVLNPARPDDRIRLNVARILPRPARALRG
jgi:transcriptional regulator with XRE-family HTH domain